MYICMHVCMYVCVCVCMYVYTYVHFLLETQLCKLKYEYNAKGGDNNYLRTSRKNPDIYIRIHSYMHVSRCP